MKAIFSKRLAIPLLLVVAISTTVGVKALSTPVPVVKHVKADEVTQTQPIIQTQTAPPPTTTSTTAPVSSSSTQPSTAADTPQPPAPKTTDELKAEAAQRITDDGNNVQQIDCFNRIIDYRYSWNISESEMLHRIDNIEQLYTSFCSGWSVIKTYPPTGPNTPPGFRD